MPRSISIPLLFLGLCVAPGARAEPPTLSFQAEIENLPEAVPELAREVLEEYREEDRETYLDNRFRLEILARRYAEATKTLEALRELREAKDPDRDSLALLPYGIYSKAKTAASVADVPFEEAFARELHLALEPLSDRIASDAAWYFSYSLPVARRQLESALEEHRGDGRMALADALSLARQTLPYLVYREILPLAGAALAEDDERRYAIQDDVLVRSGAGATLSVMVVRPRRFTSPQPAALLFNIYSDPGVNLEVAKQAAAHGFVGVVADARGKRLSPDPIRPYEHEVEDTRAVIDWISRQTWSDGTVGMFGGSYNGFAQWAATKRLHPALKTIVPAAASVPGLAWPMQNNVFLNANYCWSFQVTNDKLDAPAVCRDSERWDAMVETWYAGGRPYREIDQVDGTPNELLQRWLAHPSYDEYWQGMVPHGEDFAKIDIPVLTITGYWDDNQTAALHYLREHYRYREDAQHYLLIGPYDHMGSQGRPAPIVRGYSIDPVARIHVPEITFQWLEHVLRGGERPSLVKDKINYQVMGTNEWRHVSTLAEMSAGELVLYLSDETSGDRYRLRDTRPSNPGSLRQEVDLADRSTTGNDDYCPAPIVRDRLEPGSALVFVSEPFAAPVELNGAFTGQLQVMANKADFDFGITLYELLPAGRYLHLSYFLGRASYAADPAVRRLLTPGEVESIPIRRTYLTSRRIEVGSRLVAVLDVNKNPWAQINYGTGGDVSDESIEDAGAPLVIEWHGDSHLVIPVGR